MRLNLSGSMRPVLALITVLMLVAAVPAVAQTRLTLAEAIARARTQNLDARLAATAEREATARIAQARGSYLPKVDLAESFQRGDQPVFVFSSLLAQRQFTAANFAIDALNHPDPINNFRTAVTVEQALFNRATAARLRSTRIDGDLAAAGRISVNQDLAVQVTEAYGRVLTAVAGQSATTTAIATAQADRELAGNRRDVGRATDADVLQFDVYLARVHAQQIRAGADERIARARLNQIIGEPLDSFFTLDLASEAGAVPDPDLMALEAAALANRPDIAIAVVQERQAAASRDSARAAFLPEVGAQFGWEMNGSEWDSRSPSWVAGVVARVNLFQGFTDRARLAEAREQITRRSLERQKVETAARLEVRIALARLEAARAGEAVGRLAADQARESRRIIRDRYESGLADIVALLRASELVQDADTRQVGAAVEVVLAAAAMNQAVGK
jgi:outer membrane protein